LPLPSFYLPSEVGGDRDQPAIPIGESVLGVSPTEGHSAFLGAQPRRQPRRPPSHFVVVNLSEDD